MKFGKFAMAVTAFGAAAFGSGAQAAGYFGVPNKRAVEGWACNPSLPNYQGWLHFYRDDGKVLGAAHANIQREEAVGAACGDGGAHGFQGTLDYPAEYLDNKWHTVRAYFLNPDGSNLELQNSVEVLFDGGPQPYVFNYQTTGACTIPSPFEEIPGWLQTAADLSLWAYCPQYSGYGIARTYVNAGDPAIPTGSELEICAAPKTVAKIPTGWQVVSGVSSGACVRAYSTQAIPPNKPIFFDVLYYEKLKIRKMN